MRNVRKEILELEEMGTLPLESTNDLVLIGAYQNRLHSIIKPITDDEARILVTLFDCSDDGCFGLADTMLHLIETAPNWPLKDCLINNESYWVLLMKERCMNAGIVFDK
jgi:hypothetical protein